MKHKVILKKSVFPVSPDIVWEKLQQLTTLQYIAKPFASFLPLNRTGDLTWEENKTFQFYFKLFCLLPFGVHTIHVVQFQKDIYQIYTNEVNTHVPVWNHRIVLKEIDKNTTEYTDEVEIFAGWKTPFVCLWANLFYTHRQKKWLKLL